jgi:hypothetical protein
MTISASAGAIIQNVIQAQLQLFIGAGAEEVNAGLHQLIEVLARAQQLPAQMVTRSPSFSYDAPLPVQSQVARPVVVAQALELLQGAQVLALVAGSAIGKTQLALMLVASRTHTWARLGRRSAGEAVQVVAYAAENAAAKGHELLVLDDLGRVSEADALSEDLLTLAQQPFKVLITSPFGLQGRLRNALGSAYAELHVPLFSKEETQQLLILSGVPSNLRTDAVVDFIRSVTRGHPWLMQAAVTYLRQRNWLLDKDTLRGIFQGEHTNVLRASVLQMLRETVPDDAARELLYRLDLVVGTIGKEQVEAVADIENPIRLPAEKLRSMLGLWVQEDVGGRWQISPLLSGLGRENLETRVVRSVRLALAEVILDRRTFTVEEVERGIQYLVWAEAHDRAGVLYMMALTSYLNEAQPTDYVPPVLTMWLGQLPREMSVPIKVVIRSLQLRLMDHLRRDALPYVNEIESLLGSAPESTATTASEALSYVFAAISAGPLRSGTNGLAAVRLARMALRYFENLQLPHGEVLPEEIAETIEEFSDSVYNSVWMSAAVAKTPAIAREWLALLRSLPRRQLASSNASGALSQGAMYYIPRALLMEEEAKSKEQQDWQEIEEVLIEMENTGAETGLPFLAASACAVRVVLLAAHRHDLNAAKTIARHALSAYGSASEAEFALREALGTQLAWAEQPVDAVVELERAAMLGSELSPLAHIEVLIRLSALTRTDNKERTLSFARRAVELAKQHRQVLRQVLIMALAELAIALGDTQGVVAAFESWNEGASELLAKVPRDVVDKGLATRFGHCVGYYMSLAKTGRPPPALKDGSEYMKPQAGLFLREYKSPSSVYGGGTHPLLASQMGMYADAVGNDAASLEWSQRVARLVDHSVPPDVRTMLVPTLLPVQIFEGSFAQAIASCVDVGGMMLQRHMKVSTEKLPSDELELTNQAEALGRALMLLSAYLRAATLKLQGDILAHKFAQGLVTACQERAHESASAEWLLAGRVIERAFAPDVDRRELLQLRALAKRMGEESLDAISMVAISLLSDTTPEEAIAVQSRALFQYQQKGAGRQFGIMARLITLPFLAVFWRNSFERSGFRFSAPWTFKAKLADAIALGGEAGIRALLKICLEALSVDVPESERVWLRGS